MYTFIEGTKDILAEVCTPASMSLYFPGINETYDKDLECNITLTLVNITEFQILAGRFYADGKF